MRMVVDRGGSKCFVTEIEEMEGAREAYVEEGSHLYLSRTGQAS